MSIKRKSPPLFAGILLSSLLLGSCSAAPSRAPESAALPQSSEQSRQNGAADQAGSSQQMLDVSSPAKTTSVPQQKAQLIKTATLKLRVKDFEPSLQRATKIISARGGDLLTLEDNTPPSDASYHTASLKFRVPQTQLDATLGELSTIGTVESRTIQAEDVAAQIVDSDARLKNLRRAESVVLGIMNRSGSVGDVLKVSQELNQIRGDIERLQAQVQQLKLQVAYSTVNVTLKAAIAQNQQGVPLGERLHDTWSQSTHALGKTTTGLLNLGIWLLVFSPYLVSGTVLILLLRKATGRRQPTPKPSATSEN